MGAINDAFNKAGWSILSLASATAKYRARRNEEGKNRAKLNYSTAATIKKQNNELTKKQSENPKSYLDINSPLPPEKAKKPVQRFGELAHAEETFKQADAPTEKEVVGAKKPVQSFGELAGVEEAPAPEQKVLEPMVQESAKAASFDELPTVSAEHSETNIDAKDPEVQGLIELKQKNSLRATAGKRSQKRYQNIKAQLTSRFADYSNIDDAWKEISLAPDITDEMIRKAGFTKTQILEEWQWFKDSPSDWMRKQNLRGDEYGIIGSEGDAEFLSDYDFGGMLSDYIRAKAGGKTLAQQEEEYELSKAAKQKNALRAAAASRAQKDYQASKGYENDFPIRDYMPTVSDEELRKAGITKTELNKLSSILAGNGTDEDVRNWFKEHGGEEGAYTINLDDLYVTKQAADAIKNYILDKDKYESIGEAMEEYELKQAKNKKPPVDDWYFNFDRNYKVWQDEPTEEETDEEKKDKGIIF